MTQHVFTPYKKPSPCSQCDLFGEPCTSCAIKVDTCTECEGRSDITDHIHRQNCARCGQVKDCTFFPKVGKRICLTCAGLYLRELDVKAAEKQELGQIKGAGDIFNAKIMSFQELEIRVNSDESIPSGDKSKAYHDLIANRIIELKERIFNLDKEKHDAYMEQKAGEHLLRQFGDAVRAEVRERIKIADEKYQPAQVKKVVVKKIGEQKKLSPFDKMVKIYSEDMGISIEAARLMLEKGMKKTS